MCVILLVPVILPEYLDIIVYLSWFCAQLLSFCYFNRCTIAFLVQSLPNLILNNKLLYVLVSSECAEGLNPSFYRQPFYMAIPPFYPFSEPRTFENPFLTILPTMNQINSKINSFGKLFLHF